MWQSFRRITNEILGGKGLKGDCSNEHSLDQFEYCYFVLQQTTKRNIPMLFVRGDGVILVSPPLRVGL